VGIQTEHELAAIMYRVRIVRSSSHLVTTPVAAVMRDIVVCGLLNAIITTIKDVLTEMRAYTFLDKFSDKSQICHRVSVVLYNLFPLFSGDMALLD
jgi:negative regulator of replication initiation